MRRSIAGPADRDLGLEPGWARRASSPSVIHELSRARWLVVGRVGVDDDVVLVVSAVHVEPAAASDQHEAWVAALREDIGRQATGLRVELLRVDAVADPTAEHRRHDDAV